MIKKYVYKYGCIVWISSVLVIAFVLFTLGGNILYPTHSFGAHMIEAIIYIIVALFVVWLAEHDS